MAQNFLDSLPDAYRDVLKTPMELMRVLVVPRDDANATELLTRRTDLEKDVPGTFHPEDGRFDVKTPWMGDILPRSEPGSKEELHHRCLNNLVRTIVVGYFGGKLGTPWAVYLWKWHTPKERTNNRSTEQGVSYAPVPIDYLPRLQGQPGGKTCDFSGDYTLERHQSYTRIIKSKDGVERQYPLDIRHVLSKLMPKERTKKPVESAETEPKAAKKDKSHRKKEKEKQRVENVIGGDDPMQVDGAEAEAESLLPSEEASRVIRDPFLEFLKHATEANGADIELGRDDGRGHFNVQDSWRDMIRGLQDKPQEHWHQAMDSVGQLSVLRPGEVSVPEAMRTAKMPAESQLLNEQSRCLVQTSLHLSDLIFFPEGRGAEWLATKECRERLIQLDNVLKNAWNVWKATPSEAGPFFLDGLGMVPVSGK